MNDILKNAEEYGVNLRISLDEQGILAKIDRATNGAQKVLDNQVLKDSNFYCPMESGTLKKSAILSTVLGSGVIVWNTPYAKKQYYDFPHKSKELNPNAQGKWFEAAKSRNLKNWEKIASDQFGRDFR